MAVREVVVEVTAKYVTKVIAENPTQARELAREKVLTGKFRPYETDEVILDVRSLYEGPLLTMDDFKEE